MLRAGFALLFWWGAMAAQSMPEAASQLAARISSLLPRRSTVSLEVRNLTALPQSAAASLRSVLEDELRKAGLEIAAGQSETRVRVTISENARGPLLVAELPVAESRQVILQPWTPPAAPEAKPRFRIVRTPVFEQPEPVLDFALLDSGSTLVILSAGRVAMLRLQDGKWTPAAVAALAPARPMPRDARGRLQIAQSGFHAYVPGTTCSGVLQPALKITCAAGNETWPLNPVDAAFQVRWVTDRNVLESDAGRLAFYSAVNGAVAGADGRMHDRAGEALSGTEGWGSDLASIEAACGAAVLLVDHAGEGPDQIDTYDLASLQAAGEPLALSGPVTVLWPSETRGQATLVVQNSKTGNYEASRLGVACAQ